MLDFNNLDIGVNCLSIYYLVMHINSAFVSYSLDQDNLSHSDESSDVQPGQIDDQNIQVPHRTLSSVLSRLSNILDRRSTVCFIMNCNTSSLLLFVSQ